MSIKDLLAAVVMVACVIALGQHLGVQHILRTASAGNTPAQQRTIYDASGRIAGHVTTDSQGTTTIYDAAGGVRSEHK
jgi:YD repeat-containing protein